MTKVTGIKSVDLKIKAVGNGVVNYNGSTSLMGGDGKDVKNHKLPKLIGFTPYNGNVKDENGYKYKIKPTEIDVRKNPMYVSNGCIKYHLFKEYVHSSHFANPNDPDSVLQLLASHVGLLMGYVLPSTSSLTRKSPLYIQPFQETLCNGNFEQCTKAGERDNTSIHSKTSFGDTSYLSYASINIEELQFICADAKFGRQAIVVNTKNSIVMTETIESYIQSLNPDIKPTVTFHDQYVRKGNIYRKDQAQSGFLLDGNAIQILVEDFIDRLNELSFFQADGYLSTSSVLVDYNDSRKAMRIKTDENDINEIPTTDYACYYERLES